MKSIFKFIVSKILSRKAKKELKASHTQVIAITGSIGKTSTKEAIYTILKDSFKTYRSPKGFNTQLGISLSILQEEKSGFSSPIEWLKIINRAFRGKREAFQKMILEMGADSPGDIRKLVKIAKPQIGVVTNVNPVHLADGQFKDLDDITNEKNNLIRFMSPADVAILNADDERVTNMETKAKKITFGIQNEADVRAKNVRATNRGLSFDVMYNGNEEHFELPILGKYQVYVLLPAIAVGVTLGISLKKAAKALADYKLPPGRANPIAGVNDSDIIDGSYNASPTSMAKALELLQELKGGRKVAAIGTMNELGEDSKEIHLETGHEIAKIADLLIAVGQEATTIKQGAIEGGMDETKIFTFLDSTEAGYFLKDKIQAKDLILVKGSQNRVRMERLVKAIMKNSEQANQLLCRQDEAWEKI